MDNRFLFLEFTGDSDNNYYTFNSVKIINNINKTKTPIKIPKGNVLTIFNLSYLNFEKGKMYLAFDFKNVYYVFPLTNKVEDINTFYMNEFVIKNSKESLLQINDNMIKYKGDDILTTQYDIFDGNGLPCTIKKKVNI